MTREKELLIMQEYSKAAGKGIHVEGVEIEKNNQGLMQGIQVSVEGKTLKVVVYWSEIERKLGRDCTVESAVEYLREEVDARLLLANFDENVYDWETMKTRLRKKVVNHKKNRKRLEGIVHRTYFDLAEVPYAVLNMPGGQCGSMEIRWDIIKRWGCLRIRPGNGQKRI